MSDNLVDICQNVRNREENDPDANYDTIMQNRGKVFLISALSIASLLAVVIASIQYKKLRVHPSTLIAAICTIEALLTW